MCNPIVMLGFQVATTVAGGLAQSSEYKYQARLAQMQGRHQAAVASANAQLSRYAAERAAATQRVKMFTSGVDPKSGSAVDVLAEDRANRYLDELNEFYKGRLALWEGERQAQALKRHAKNAVYKSLISAGGTILGAGIDRGWWGGGGTPRPAGGQAPFIWDQRQVSNYDLG